MQYTRKLLAAGLLALIACAVPPPAAATLTTIWVGAGAQCDTSSLVLAITEASTAGGDNTRINLANDQSYPGFSNLALVNINVEIDGGYAHCRDTAPNGITAIVGRSDGNVMSMSSANGSRQVTLRDLDIHGGDNAGAGGGLRISGGVNAVLDNVHIHDNDALAGGGIYIAANGDTRPSLLVTGNSFVSDNTSTYDGAGIDCTLSDIVLGGANVNTNRTGETGDGGGIYLAGCTMQSAGSTSRANIFSNNVARRGGAIYADTGSTVDLGQSGGLVRINANEATSAGGGLFLSGAATRITVAATRISENASDGTGSGILAGGGVFVTNGALFELDRGDRDEVCSGPSPCAELVSNQASAGSEAYAFDGGRVRLNNCEIDNSGFDAESVLGGNGNGSSITLNGVLMDRLVAMAAVRLESGAVAIGSNLTVAGNDVGSDFFLNGPNTSLNLQNSIVWDSPAIAVEGSGSVFSLNNNSFDPATLPGLDFDPGFADPDHHDFHPRVDSPDVDAYTPMAYVPSFDLDGNPRPFDLPVDHGGIFDRGAYELGDEIFADGFDP
ncbi:MAG: hypothetical protein WBW61_00015 [Rhodanobacteraceae bacterium]